MTSTTNSSETPYGHVLSTKSKDIDRDTFFFITLSRRSELFLGVNQKLTPVSSATIHRWVNLMTHVFGPEEFFLCPVTVHSAGIMAYFVRPSGPAIEPYSTEPLPPGNYGWYFDRACMDRGFPALVNARKRLCTFQTRLIDEEHYYGNEFAEPSSAETSLVVARDKNRCRFTGSAKDTVLAWIVPAAVAWESDDLGLRVSFDNTPFLVASNVLTMQSELRFHFYSNHFTVDVDDGYRILVLRAMGEAQQLLPTHLPLHAQHDVAADHFLRLHCRYSLSVMLRGGDIQEDYPNHVILRMMHELRVDYAGNEDRDVPDMVPFGDDRWQTDLGKAIMANVLQGRLAHNYVDSDSPDEASFDEDEEIIPVVSDPPSSNRNSPIGWADVLVSWPDGFDSNSGWTFEEFQPQGPPADDSTQSTSRPASPARQETSGPCSDSRSTQGQLDSPSVGFPDVDSDPQPSTIDAV